MADYHKFTQMKPVKFFTRRLEKRYASTVSYSAPARMRVLRKSHKTAAGASEYSRLVCDIYERIFGVVVIDVSIPVLGKELPVIVREPSAADDLPAIMNGDKDAREKKAKFDTDVAAVSDMLKNDLPKLYEPVRLSLDDVFAGREDRQVE